MKEAVLKMVSTLLKACVILLLAALLSVFAASRYFTMRAAAKAEDILGTMPREDPMALAENVGKWMARHFELVEPPRWQRSLYLWENSAIPSLLRVDTGAFEVLWPRGNCSDAARGLVFLFTELGMTARQHDLVNSVYYGHSVLSVKIDGKWRMLDPYMGIAFKDRNELLPLADVLARKASGEDITRYVAPLKEPFRTEYYTSDARIFHALQGEPMRVDVLLTRDGNCGTYGRIDGREDDTAEDMKGKIPPYLWILGRRYVKNMQYVFTTDDTLKDGARIAFTLTEEPDPDNLPASNVRPRLDGKSLTYDLPPETGPLILDVSTMGWRSGRFGLHLPWYNVDSLSIEPLRGN